MYTSEIPLCKDYQIHFSSLDDVSVDTYILFLFSKTAFDVCYAICFTNRNKVVFSLLCAWVSFLLVFAFLLWYVTTLTYHFMYRLFLFLHRQMTSDIKAVTANLFKSPLLSASFHWFHLCSYLNLNSFLGSLILCIPCKGFEINTWL